MIISKEKWNTLTCKEVLGLMQEYNKTASSELKFTFTKSDKWYLNNRLQHGPITFKAHRESFNTDALASEVFKNDLSYTDFMTLEEYIEHELHQNPKGRYIKSGAMTFINPYAGEA